MLVIYRNVVAFRKRVLSVIRPRLGAFGWVSTPNEDIDQNAGLHDTRAAFEWIRSHIHKFGGDKDKVTAMGESAGGGVIIHHITANGGRGEPIPFQQVYEIL
jgi:carboxylesterase type B